jgi:hypothetical protein
MRLTRALHGFQKWPVEALRQQRISATIAVTKRKGPPCVATSGPKSREETPKEGSDRGPRGLGLEGGSLPHDPHEDDRDQRLN